MIHLDQSIIHFSALDIRCDVATESTSQDVGNPSRLESSPKIRTGRWY